MTAIMARDLNPGDYYHGRTPLGIVTYLILQVDVLPERVDVYSLREYAGLVANYQRTYSIDESINFRKVHQP